MDHEPSLTFGPFRLEVAHSRVWQGDQVTALRPRTVAMLRYLVAHPGPVVTKAELRQHVWGGTHVSDTVLRVCVQEIRAALRDSATAPCYLETVAGQGYRWLVGGDLEVPPALGPGPLVGRQREVEALERWFQRAAHRTRQLVLVSGDAGVGKTTVVDLCLARLGVGTAVRMARGHCVEQFGEGEPYLPVLEALGQLSRGPGHREVRAALRRYAPMWLVQLPGLLPEVELERLQRQVQGATPARMLRELAEVLDVLTADVPLVLVLEDLHWSDRSTVEALTAVAQRREPARLLILGTYRPAEAALRGHPVRGMAQELCGRGQAVELRLERLPVEDVAAYLVGRLGGPVAGSLAAFIHARTEGHALFLVTIVEHLVQQGLVVRHAGAWTLRAGGEAQVASLPEEVRQLLLRRIEALPPAVRQVLEAASVVGEAFAVAAVAAGAQCPVAEVDAVCEGLARQQHFITDAGLTVWPDTTSGGSYRFQHVLYQQVLYEQVGSGRRAQLHRRIGARLEASAGARAGDLAAQLAVHFERGGEVPRAVSYWQQVGDQAARRQAHPEAIAALRQGLALLATVPDSPERTRHELTLQLSLGELLMAAQGMASPEAGEVYTHAQALCDQGEETTQRFRVLWGLCVFHTAQARLPTGAALSQQLFELAQRQPDPVLVVAGHVAVGVVALFRGDLVIARTHLEQSVRLGDPWQPPTPPFYGGYHPGVSILSWIAQILGGLGYADQARQRCQEALALARQLEHPPSLAYAELSAAILAQCRRDVASTQAHADAVMALAEAHGLALRLEQGRMLRGWALAMRGDVATGVAHIRQGLAASHGVGPEILRPHWLALLAEAYGQAGQPEAGLTVLAEALTRVAATEAHWWEAEVLRLKGALLRQRPRPEVPQADACWGQALEVAHRQQAKALELRVALSLSRVWPGQGTREDARQLLAGVYHWFTEGFDTADLQEAKALLDALA